MNLTPEEKEVGQHNYYAALGVNRRQFLQGIAASGVVASGGLGAMYFGYQKVADPVRIGIIGTGDEGNVLIGGCSPEYVDVVAIADVRPSSIHRAFHGDWASPAAAAARPGLLSVYGWKNRAEAEKHVKVYQNWEDLLDQDDVEAVIIALPLFLHAPVAIQAMKKGKHVLTEKLMAQNIAQCKSMSRFAEQLGKHLATGHQRHYSVLYDNAVQLLRWGLLGEIHHIRAQWHRGNLPGRDSWAQPIPGGEHIVGKPGEVYDKIGDQLKSFQRQLERAKDGLAAELLRKKVAQWTAWDSDQSIRDQVKDFGYEDITLGNGRTRTALEELVRWRLWERTGGGLMAELGSHQLDAASIFISSLRQDGKKAHPLSVHAVGGRHTFPLDRDAYDHVYCMFEFPGPGYEPGFDVGYSDRVSEYPSPEKGIPAFSEDPNKKVVVTYSSINGNGFGGYGEVVMGTKGTLVLEREQEVMVFKDSSTSTKVGVKDDAGGPSMDTQASGDMAAATAMSNQPVNVSRGYQEEIEHWAYCIRNNPNASDPEVMPRCKPEVAVADAVIALTAKVAMENSNAGKGGYIEFEDAHFDIHNDATPDGSSIAEENKAMGV